MNVIWWIAAELNLQIIEWKLWFALEKNSKISSCLSAECRRGSNYFAFVTIQMK